MDLEQRIRQRAYDLWERAGRPNDQSDAFWRQARAEIEGDALPIGDRRTTDAAGLASEEQASAAKPEPVGAKSARRPASTDAESNGPRKSHPRRR